MTDDRERRGPQDHHRINVNEDFEVRWWTNELGITGAELRAAVAAVGVMAIDVREYLARKRISR